MALHRASHTAGTVSVCIDGTKQGSFPASITNASGHALFVVKFAQTSSDASSRRTEDAAGALVDGATTTIQVSNGQTWMAVSIDAGTCLGLYRGPRGATTISSN